LHPNNLHLGKYDFDSLKKSTPQLSEYLFINKFGIETIDFFNPKAVKSLNKALLKHFYKINYWDIPENYLCPPIPGRADYIHFVAELFSKKKKSIKCLDIGMGANCIYPIIGTVLYNWEFVGSDIDTIALQNAKDIVSKNEFLKGKIDFRHQIQKDNIFESIIHAGEKFDLTICNPPFHSSADQANSGSKRKIRNLTNDKNAKIKLNFSGQSNELWCEGGELNFIRKMILESEKYSSSVLWFTTLVSKKDNLNSYYKILKQVKVYESKVIEMSQGNKISHLLIWTFKTKIEQELWMSF